MARQIQLRRGTSAQHTTFTGAVGELTFSTDTKTLRVHDGETPGGIELARSDRASDMTGADYVVAFQAASAANNNIWYRKYKSGWVEQGGYLGTLAANASKTITFPIPYRGLHDYFIMALGMLPGVCWEGGNNRTAASCVIKNTSTSTNYIDLYTCGWAA